MLDQWPRTYREGEMTPGPRNWLMEQEQGGFAGPQRDEALIMELGLNRNFRNQGVMSDGSYPSGWAARERYPYPARTSYPFALY
jgi:hypothetical protein